MRWPAGIDTRRAREDDSIKIAAEQKRRDEIILSHGLPPSLIHERFSKQMRQIEEAMILAPPPKPAGHPLHVMDFEVGMNPDDFAVLRKMTPLPVKLLKTAGRAMSFPVHERQRVTAFGESVPPISNVPFRTLTIERGQLFIDPAGELVMVV